MTPAGQPLTRLDKAIRRLKAQRACLDWAVAEVAGIPGVVDRIRPRQRPSFDHLRARLPEREIYVFERNPAGASRFDAGRRAADRRQPRRDATRRARALRRQSRRSSTPTSAPATTIATAVLPDGSGRRSCRFSHPARSSQATRGCRRLRIQDRAAGGVGGPLLSLPRAALMPVAPRLAKIDHGRGVHAAMRVSQGRKSP